MVIRTFDGTGHIENGYIAVQMKSSDSSEYSKDGDFVTVRVDERGDSFWRGEGFPVALVLYDPAKDTAYFVHYQTVPQSSRRSVRIPTVNRFDADAARQLRDAKNAVTKG